MMIPITRIEQYINEIVGNGGTAPDQPITREEIFYAAILGEVPTIPTPITNEEKYLSAIANNYTDDLPQPVTRIEKFLAKIAGVEGVEVPAPLTNIEMLWNQLLNPMPKGIIADSWATISERSRNGTAHNYYSVGDYKKIRLKGTIGTLPIDQDVYVYILGFNHNAEIEGSGITFGGFVDTTTQKSIALVDNYYGESNSTGLKWFNMNHYGNFNYGGWKGCDVRYDILGSTDIPPSGYGEAITEDRQGYDASEDCAIKPVPNTLMSCLPVSLRSVMKPILKYTDNVGGGSALKDNVSMSIDYLPLLSEYEIFGLRTYANTYEQEYQRQYDYYKQGDNRVKRKHNNTNSAAHWRERSPHHTSPNAFCFVQYNGAAGYVKAENSYGIAPIFKV